MAYILMIAGAIAIFLGFKMPISQHTPKELADQKIEKTFNAGCRGYLKYMLIIGGIVLIIIGIVIN